MHVGRPECGGRVPAVGAQRERDRSQPRDEIVGRLLQRVAVPPRHAVEGQPAAVADLSDGERWRPACGDRPVIVPRRSDKTSAPPCRKAQVPWDVAAKHRCGCDHEAMDRRALDDLRRLAELDDELGAHERRLQELDETVRELRGRAEALEAFFAGYDEAERRTRSAAESSRAEVERRRAEVGEAKTALADARDDERRELARRALARAEDHLSVAEIALGRSSTDASQLERQAADWQRELPLLEARAGELSADLRDVEAPDSGAPALIAWASHAHASLFVAVRQLEAERERVIREANELASALVGEPTYGSTPAQALARVEHS